MLKVKCCQFCPTFIVFSLSRDGVAQYAEKSMLKLKNALMNFCNAHLFIVSKKGVFKSHWLHRIDLDFLKTAKQINLSTCVLKIFASNTCVQSCEFNIQPSDVMSTHFIFNCKLIKSPYNLCSVSNAS